MSSCVGCASTFGLFRKENGCPCCGFSFCSKCLNHQVPLPNAGGSVVNVCKKCKEKQSTSGKKQHAPESLPPVVLEKKLEQLEDPTRPPITVYTDTSRLGKLKRGLSVEDQAIVDRLERLRAEMKAIRSVPSQEEIEHRLAKLKGMNPDVFCRPSLPVQPKQRPGVDPVTALMEQTNEEMMIDVGGENLPKGNTESVLENASSDDPEVLLAQASAEAKADAEKALKDLHKDQEIRQRLERLRIRQGEEAKAKEISTSPCDDDDEDSEEMAAAKIIQKAMDDNILEDIEASGSSDDELPWCQLCNGDPVFRCLGCGGDIYCRSCWKETHGLHDPEYRSHTKVPYSPPPSKKR